jgi:hypothetical protein
VLIRITADGQALLEEAEDLRRFALRFDPGARGTPAGDAALARIARPDGEHAWVSEAWLRATAPRGAAPDWQAGFAAMLDFARGRGWVDDQGGIRAHIEA